MRSSESLQGRMQSHHTPGYFFRHPKRTTYIGAWNVRSLIDVVKAAQVARVMEMNRCEILGLREMSWGGFGRVKLKTEQTLLFSGREDNLHRQGVGILMLGNATKALIYWKPVNERIITARFYSKYVI